MLRSIPVMDETIIDCMKTSRIMWFHILLARKNLSFTDTSQQTPEANKR